MHANRHQAIAGTQGTASQYKRKWMGSPDLLPNLLARKQHLGLLLKSYMTLHPPEDYPRGIIRPA